MFRYLVEAGNNMTIKENSSMCQLLQIKFHYGKRCIQLPQIDDALQAVHSSNWISSLDLSQGHFQLAIEENSIKKDSF